MWRPQSDLSELTVGAQAQCFDFVRHIIDGLPGRVGVRTKHDVGRADQVHPRAWSVAFSKQVGGFDSTLRGGAKQDEMRRSRDCRNSASHQHWAGASNGGTNIVFGLHPASSDVAAVVRKRRIATDGSATQGGFRPWSRGIPRIKRIVTIGLTAPQRQGVIDPVTMQQGLQLIAQ